MLNRENAVIAYETERGNKVTPILLTVAEADRAEYPRTVDLVAVMLGIENAGALGVEFIDLRILGMNVVDGISEITDSGYGIDSLPYKVRRIEVSTDNGTDSLAELHKLLGIVDAEAGVKLESDAAYAVFERKFGCLLPIRNKHVIPLIIENRKILLGPCAGRPVRHLIAGSAAGTAGECDHGIKSELLGEKNGVDKIVMVTLCLGLVGMHGVAVARKSAKLDIVFLESILEFFEIRGRRKKLLRIAVSLAGVSARADLGSLYAESLELCESLFKRILCIKICKYTEFHMFVPFLSIFYCAIKTMQSLRIA